METFREFVEKLNEKVSAKEIKSFLDFGKSKGYNIGKEKTPFGTVNVVKIKGKEKEVNAFILDAEKKGMKVGVLDEKGNEVLVALVDDLG